MKDRDLEELLRKLNRRDVVGWLPEMERGRVAYDYLLAALEGPSMGESHTANVLRALFRLRGHVEHGRFVSVLERYLGDARIGVRSAASNLLIGLIKMREVELSDPLATKLRTAVDLGLLTDARAVAEEVLSQGSSR